MNDQPSLKPLILHYVGVVWRRKKILLLAPLLLAFVAYYVMKIPPVYQSAGRIQIETSNLPANLVTTPVSTLAAEQMALIRQQLEATDNVMGLIEKHSLYPEIGDGDSQSMVQLFRDSLNVRTIQADILDQSGRRIRADIAFIVSFKDQSPIAAKNVATDIIDTFLEKNTEIRSREATKTVEFLKKEADTLQVRVTSLEDQIAAYKNENGRSLPDLLEYNLNVISNNEQRLSDILVAKDTLFEQEQVLSIELRSIDPYTGLSLSSVLTADRGPLSSTEMLAQRRNELSQLLTRYSDSHPSILSLRREIVLLEAELADLDPEKLSSQQPFSSGYLQLEYRINSIKREIKSLDDESERLRAQIVDFNSRVERTYLVERQLDELERDYLASLSKYEDLRSAQYEAEVGQSLESDNTAERLTLIEAPNIPRYPVEPARSKLLFFGIIVVGGFLLGIILLLEIIDDNVWGLYGIKPLLGGQAPLTIIPKIATLQDGKLFRARFKKIVFIILGLLILCVVSAVMYTHFFVTDIVGLFTG